MIETILKVLVIIAAFQTLLFAIHLFFKKKSSFSRNILASLFLCFGIFLTGYLFLFIKDFLIYKLAHLANLFIFLTAPLLYIYFISVIEGKSSLVKNDLLHLLPFGLIFLVMTYHLNFNLKEVMEFRFWGTILLGLMFIQNIIYLILISRKFLAAKINLFKTPLSIISEEFRWITSLVRVFSIIFFLQLFTFIVCNLFARMEFCIVLTGIFFVVSFLVMNSVVLIGLSKPDMFDFKQKYKSSSLSEDQKSEYLGKLEKELLNDKCFLDPLLTLDRLAKKLKIPKNFLSQIINEKYQTSFNGLINQYRVKEAIIQMQKTNGSPIIIDIAYSVGYNSKSTFNIAFKKFTGMTPSEYIESQCALN